jgi:hypothetical protein
MTMSEHLHATLVPGCYRCELGRDEMEAIRQEIEAERAQIRQGLCPRSGKRIMPNGILRPACSFCECGEFDD